MKFIITKYMEIDNNNDRLFRNKLEGLCLEYDADIEEVYDE